MSIVVAPIGERIKALRKQKKISQKDLAEKLGITSNTLYRYEHGDISISLEMLHKIAEALDMSFLELVDGISIEYKYTVSNIDEINKKIRELFSDTSTLNHNIFTYYCQLNSSGKEKLTDYAEYLTTKEEYTKPDEE